ncbi:TolC family protein [Marispirochaeta sp.]|uniref:TolC family protein n=1 Tax=Marispirochaeta sp. TaxID=2038653 RepID=UPI0029C62101|nr:TolC family protein [Marispirochaeta sp.]
MGRICRILLLVAVLTLPAAARDYTIEELFELALSDDARLAQLDADLSLAESSVTAATGAFHPDLSASFRAAYTSELPEMEQPNGMGGTVNVEAGVKDTYAAALTARQVIFAGFARREGLAAAKNALAGARYQRLMREDALRFSLLQAAYSYKLADLSVGSLEASLARLELNRRRVVSFLDQGFASELDLLEIDSSIAELQLQLRQQQTDRRNALIRLRELSGADDLDQVSLSAVYLALPDPRALEIRGEKLSGNASFRALDYRLAAKEIEKELAKSAWYPKLSAFGTFNYGRPGANFFADEWQFYYTAGLEVSLDIWDGGERGASVKSAGAASERVIAERAELFRSLLARGERTEESLHSANDQLSTAEELLTQKQRKYNLVHQLWEAGQQSTLEVLEAEQELTAADIRTKRLEIRLLSLYQEFLLLINKPLWDHSNSERSGQQ